MVASRVMDAGPNEQAGKVRLAGSRAGGFARELAASEPQVRAWCQKCCRRDSGLPQTDADDLAQQVMARAWENASQFRGESDIKTWLYLLTRSVVTGRVRSRTREDKRLRVIARDRDQQAGAPTLDRLAAEGALAGVAAWLASPAGRRQIPAGETVWRVVLAAEGNLAVALAILLDRQPDQKWTRARLVAIMDKIKASRAGQQAREAAN